MESQNAIALKEFLGDDDTEFGQIILRLNALILSTDSRLQSAIKWTRLTYGIDGDFHHWICGLSRTKKSVALIFHFGGLLNDEQNLLAKGTSKFIRKIDIASVQKIDQEAIQGFIMQAIDKLPYFIENWKAISKEP